MSEKNNEYNSDAPPRQGPEPTLREGGYVGAGNLVTMHQAQQGNGNESFPVLQAFQEYIDAERKQARKRVMQLSIGFAAILGVVVVGFLAAGVSILRNTTSMQTKLMEIVAEKSSAPVQVQSAPVQPAASPSVQSTSPALEESLREMSKVLVKMQAKTAKTPVAPTVERAPVALPPSTDPAVEALRTELAAMKAQSRKMAGELVSLRSKKSVTEKPAGHSAVVAEALARAKKTAEEKAAADKAAADAAAAAAVEKRAEAEKAHLARVEAEKEIAVEMEAERAKADRESADKKVAQPVASKSAPVVKETKAIAKAPVATKAPPVVPENVQPPKPPKNMEGQSIALKTRDGAVVPWRIFVPE